MRLKLKELQKVVDDAVLNQRQTDALREETTRAFGPVVIVKNVSVQQIAEAINDRLDVLERTGRSVEFDAAVALKYAKHPSAEVRRAVVRLLPEGYAPRFKADEDAYVRHAAAKKLSTPTVMEMFKRQPDDELRQVLIERKNDEDSLAAARRLSKGSRQPSGIELSDVYYTNIAHKAISDYSSNFEGQWDEPWVYRYCASLKATSGVDIDEKRLWDEIQRQLNDRDDRYLERHGLKETVARLRSSARSEERPRVSAVTSLLTSDYSSMEYVKRARSVFHVHEAVNRSIIAESVGGNVVPVIGMVPDGRFTREVEVALDKYVKCWSMTHRDMRLRWGASEKPGRVVFAVEQVK